MAMKHISCLLTSRLVSQILRSLCLGVWLMSVSWANSVHASSPATEPPASAASNDIDNKASTLLVIGDSISAGYGMPEQQGWVALLQTEFEETMPDWHIVNASISGETTAGGLARLPKLLAHHQPRIVVIELGGNDGLRGYPLGAMKNNLTRMIELSHAAGASPILLGIRIPPNYGPRYTEQFFNSFGEVADQTATPLLPFFLKNVVLKEGMIQDDGIHPSAAAQPVLLDTVRPLILEQMEAQPNQ